MSAVMNHASTLHPSVLAKIGEEEVRVMFDSGAGSSYLCTDVITKLNLKPARKEQRCIEQMYGTMRKIVEVYSVAVHSLAVKEFSIDVKCIKRRKRLTGRFPFSQNFRNFRFGGKWNTFRRFVPLENSQKKWKI